MREHGTFFSAEGVYACIYFSRPVGAVISFESSGFELV